MTDSTTLEEDAALNDAARMVLAEMKANPEHEVSLLVQAFVECGKAAAVQGIAGGALAEREACLADIAHRLRAAKALGLVSVPWRRTRAALVRARFLAARNAHAFAAIGGAS